MSLWPMSAVAAAFNMLGLLLEVLKHVQAARLQTSQLPLDGRRNRK